MPIGIAPERVVLDCQAQGFFQGLHGFLRVERALDIFGVVQIVGQVHQRITGEDKHARQQGDEFEQRRARQR